MERRSRACAEARLASTWLPPQAISSAPRSRALIGSVEGPPTALPSGLAMKARTTTSPSWAQKIASPHTPNFLQSGGWGSTAPAPLARRDMPRAFCAMIFGERFGGRAGVRRSMSAHRRIPDAGPPCVAGRSLTQSVHSDRPGKTAVTRTNLPFDRSRLNAALGPEPTFGYDIISQAHHAKADICASRSILLTVNGSSVPPTDSFD